MKKTRPFLSQTSNREALSICYILVKLTVFSIWGSYKSSVELAKLSSHYITIHMYIAADICQLLQIEIKLNSNIDHLKTKWQTQSKKLDKINDGDIA